MKYVRLCFDVIRVPKGKIRVLKKKVERNGRAVIEKVSFRAVRRPMQGSVWT